MLKKVIIVLLSFNLLSGCVIGNMTGLKSGYKKLSADEKLKIVNLEGDVSIEKLVISDTIYNISSKEIENYLNTMQGELVIYLWSPNCSSSYCYPLEYIHEICLQRNQKLIIIIEYYDMSQIESQKLDKLDFPLFSINSKFYGTDFCNRYVNLFFADLLNMKKVPEEILYKSYFLFTDGQFVKSVSDIAKY